MSVGLAFWLLAALPWVEARSITPMRRQAALKLLSHLAESDARTVSIDIGGTLAKIVVFQPEFSPPAEGEIPRLELGEASEAGLGDVVQRELSVYAPQLHGSLHFFVFETRQISSVIDFLSRHWPQARAANGARRQLRVRATGGGSYKHAEAFRQIGITLETDEELTCTVAGLNFLLHSLSAAELFKLNLAQKYSPLATPAACAEVARNYVPVPVPPDRYLYVSIGSGVSIMQVERTPSGQTGYRCSVCGVWCVLILCTLYARSMRVVLCARV